MLSLATSAIDLLSVSVVDNGTIGCFLLHQEITPEPRLNTYLVLDLWVL